MIEHDVLYLGLSRTELQTLRCLFPLTFNFYQICADDLNDDSNIEVVVSKSWCLFVNPKKLTTTQLSDLIYIHEHATKNTHATALLFTDAFTKEQKRALDTTSLHRIDLHARFDKKLHNTVEIMRKATMPCWDGLQRMESNCFNDGWYLIDMEVTGLNPIEDDIFSLSISYMANYEIKSIETIYIKQHHPISEELESLTGITNEMLENGITKDEAIEYLNNLPYRAPIILESAKYEYTFLKALFHSCGQKFDLPHVTLDGLVAIVFGHMLCKRTRDILAQIPNRKYPRTPMPNPYLAQLYDLTLAVFENLQDRYDVRFPGQFHSLYYSEILCDN